LDKKQKEQELASLKDKMARAKQIIIADHTGINVADLTILRRKLKDAKSEFRVSKNTLLKLAIKDSALSVLEKHFVGPTAVIFGYDDPSVPAKIIYDSIKDKEKPRFKAYYLDGQVYGQDILKQIAELPPREVVLAILIATVQGPIAQFIRVLDAASVEFVGTLDALAKSREEKEG
jgi:large subunit ribosomal protein L10